MAPLMKGTLAPWLKGEVRRHCARCEAEVERLARACPQCGLPLRKECPSCHYWGEIDRAYCLACRHSFPLPAPSPATVKIWHEQTESGMTKEERTIVACPSAAELTGSD